ncbi:sensor histidine kinase [Kitasatospora kifunensis]|uniref:histidine kinase n=1 Tax=Kitasatospora kifunensis TaxID=58351 RepID=A0A7W7QXC2_KITKI|nr:sensor histidine kinase [Kitasatospora kifunensis]MBB4921546.1 signal transduction histidine kinase [Kitasatospora kifunensis]
MATGRRLTPLTTLTRRVLNADGLPWTRSDALLCVAAAVVDLLGYTLVGLDRNQPVTAAGLLLFVLAALPLLVQRRYPRASLTAVLAVNLTVNLAVPGVGHHFGASLAVALFAAARVGRAVVTAPAGLACATVSLLGQGQALPPSAGALSSAVVSTTLVITTAVLVNRYQSGLEAKRRLLADHAVAKERRRIARELHDIVAHHITTMQLMAGGARANLGGDTEVVRDALVTLESSGRLALREMRQLLDVLRAGDEVEEAPSAPQPGTGDLERLVAESRLAGLPTEFSVRGRQRPLPPSLGLTVFRIVQEALTNARKHAGQAEAYVQLTYGHDRITVEVRDNGAGSPVGALVGAGAGHPGALRPGSGSGGYGLIGMQERVALQGGSLTAGWLESGGFRVAASLPLAAVDQEEALGAVG